MNKIKVIIIIPVMLLLILYAIGSYELHKEEQDKAKSNQAQGISVNKGSYSQMHFDEGEKKLTKEKSNIDSIKSEKSENLKAEKSEVTTTENTIKTNQTSLKKKDATSSGPISSAGIPCNCISNTESFEYYFDPEEKAYLVDEGYKIYKNEDGEYIISEFGYMKGEKEIFPSHVCQLPEDTALPSGAYSNFEGYYDHYLYFWREDLKDGHMFAACDS